MLLKFIVGSYTDSINKSGLKLCVFDTIKNSFTMLNELEIENTSFAVRRKLDGYIYAVNENHTKSDSITAICLSEDDALTLVNKVNCGGADPCYISLNNNDDNVIVANYSDGTVSSISIKADGSLGGDFQYIKQPVLPPNEHKQTHAHSAIFSADDKYLLTLNLGLDTIYIYSVVRFDGLTRIVEPPLFSYSFNLGTGPRHLIFSDDQRFLYVIGELNAILYVFSYHDGRLNLLEELELNDADFDGANSAADIHLSSDGKFLYASNRGDANRLYVFSVNSDSGSLEKIQIFNTNGVGPRNFAIHNLEEVMLVAYQYTNEVKVLKRNLFTGLISDCNMSIEIHSPVFVMFL